MPGLSFERRNEIARDLRRIIVAKDDPSRLVRIDDPETKIHPLAENFFAFQFFVDRYGAAVCKNKSVKENLEYNIGWCEGCLTRGEKTYSPEKARRMAAEIFMMSRTPEQLQEMQKFMLDEVGWEPPVSLEELQLFMYEVLYEIVRDFLSSMSV